MARQNGHPFQPKLGDYAVVLAGNRLYPAIFGDIGPSDLLGEASLRLAQAVDPRATPQRSPVNDLKITYLVFPGTADAAAGSAGPGENPAALPGVAQRDRRQQGRPLRVAEPDPAATHAYPIAGGQSDHHLRRRPAPTPTPTTSPLARRQSKATALHRFADARSNGAHRPRPNPPTCSDCRVRLSQECEAPVNLQQCSRTTALADRET